MKNIITILAILLTVFCTSCKKDNISAGEHEPSDGGIELAISLAGEFEMGSRSALTSSEPMHHIEHMYAYVFAVKGETGITVDNAECVYEEKLPWTATAEGATVFRCRMRPGDNFFEDKNKEYLVMVVATDNNKDTYTFPWSDDSSNADIHLGMTGRKLSEVKMDLATSAEPEQMAYTEVFAGFRKFTTSESLINVKLTRRVAGVICYLTDIPAKIDEYHIIGAELHWSDGLNSSGVLKPLNLTNDEESFAGLDSDIKVESGTTLLAKINLKEMGAEADASGELLYIPAINQEGVLKTLPNTAFMGAYMLPVKTEGQFIIKLVGEKRDVDGNVEEAEHVFTESETDGYFKVNNSSGNSTYSITADYIYNIGYKPYAENTDYDAPLSLKGDDIKVTPSDWDWIEVDVGFSDVQMGLVFDTGKTANFKYDCIETTDVLKVTSTSTDGSDDNKAWKLAIVYPAGTETNDEWLHFDNNQTELTGTGPQDVTIYLKDYVDSASPNKNNPDDDYRTVSIVFTVDETQLSTTSYIRQWNALIVDDEELKVDGKQVVAFRRLDLGYKFDKDGNVVPEDGLVQTYQWGFDEYVRGDIYDDYNDDISLSGLSNTQRIMQKHNGDDLWSNSAVGKAYNQTSKQTWYLPARVEINALMNGCFGKEDVTGQYVSLYPSMNLSIDGEWWSSTVKGWTKESSYYGSVSVKKEDDKTGLLEHEDWWNNKNYAAKKSSQFRIRQACRP